MEYPLGGTLDDFVCFFRAGRYPETSRESPGTPEVPGLIFHRFLEVPWRACHMKKQTFTLTAFPFFIYLYKVGIDRSPVNLFTHTTSRDGCPLIRSLRHPYFGFSRRSRRQRRHHAVACRCKQIFGSFLSSGVSKSYFNPGSFAQPPRWGDLE